MRLVQVAAPYVPKLSNHAMAAGLFTRAASGDEVITGLGFRPSLVILLAADSVANNRNMSTGIDNGDSALCLEHFQGIAESHVEVSHSYHIRRTAVNHIHGEVSAFAADGFTVTSILTGVCSALIGWYAIE